MESQQSEISIRTPFKEINPISPHNFNYVTGFSNDSIILVFAIGIYELFARFKRKPFSNCLKSIKHQLGILSENAKKAYPEQINLIEFYMLFLKNIEEIPDSVLAFKYLLEYTISNQESYVHLSGIGFRYIISMLFDNKPSYQNLIQSGNDLASIRGLIFYNICQTFCIQVEINDGFEKEVFKGSRIGEFPILNLLVYNSQYSLLYNQKMIDEWNGTPLDDESINQPPFKLQKAGHTPLDQQNPPNPSPSPGPSPVLNFNDTNGLLKQLVVKLSEELLVHNSFSNQFADFVSICVRNNQEVGTIRTLQKFINPYKDENSKKIVAAQFECSDILMESRVSLERSARNFVVCCSCRRSLGFNLFIPNVHPNCRVCRDCARLSSACKACGHQYSAEQLSIIRNS